MRYRHVYKHSDIDTFEEDNGWLSRNTEARPVTDWYEGRRSQDEYMLLYSYHGKDWDVSESFIDDEPDSNDDPFFWMWDDHLFDSARRHVWLRRSSWRVFYQKGPTYFKQNSFFYTPEIVLSTYMGDNNAT